MDYFFRYNGAEHFRQISYEEARTMLNEYCFYNGREADLTMLEIPNRLDVLAGEMICISPGGGMLPGSRRNMTADEYYGTAAEQERDPWVDPGKVFLGGLVQMIERDRTEARDMREREERRKQKRREKEEDKLRRKLSKWLDRHMYSRRWF